MGGPQDGARVYIRPGKTVNFETIDWQTMEVSVAVYALAVTAEGNFSLRYLSTHVRSIQ